MISALIAAIAPTLINSIFEDDKKDGDLKQQVLEVVKGIVGDAGEEDAQLAALRADPEKWMRVQERLATIQAQHAEREAKSMAEARAANLELSKQMKPLAYVPLTLALAGLTAMLFIAYWALTRPDSRDTALYLIPAFAPLAYAGYNHVLGSSIGSKLKTGIMGGLGRR